MPKRALIVYIFLGLTMIGSALTVVSRPAYSRYNELSAEIEKKLDEQRKHFDGEVMVAISNIVSQAAYLAAENIRLSAELKTPRSDNGAPIIAEPLIKEPVNFESLKIQPLSDYEFAYARVSGKETKSIRLGDWRYRVGDTFLGLKILDISADCTLLEDGTMLIPEKLYSKMKSSNSVNGNDFLCRRREDADAALSAPRNPNKEEGKIL